MLKVNTKNNSIALTRGDTCYIKFCVFDEEGNVYRLTENDEVSCYFRDAPNNGELLFRGTIERNLNSEINDANGIVLLHIKPSDTENGAIQRYYWDAQIHNLESGDVFTFINGTLKLTDEVTYDD